MTRYILLRLVQAVFVVWAVFTVTFGILFVMPSDPAEIIVRGGALGEASTEDTDRQVEQLREELGLDQPLVVQYVAALGRTVVGDWGTSYQTGRSVTDMLAESIAPTAGLAVFALGMAIVVGMGLGFLAAYTRFGPLRQMLFSLPSIGASIPTFWSALLLIQVFSFGFRIFPAFGSDGVASMVLPAVALAIPLGAVIAQVFGKSLRTAMGEPYVDTARAKGASRLRAQLRHAAKNALLPVLTIVGVLFGALIAGAVIVETVFGRQGFGRMTVEAVNAQDIPVVMGVVVFSAIVFVLASLAVDLLYPAIDPRLRTVRRPIRSAAVKAA